MFGSAVGGAKDYNSNMSTELPDCPNDGVSQLAWSSKANHLAASSWDKTVRIWEVRNNTESFGNNQIAAQGMVQYTHDAPVLCCNFTDDGQKVISGGCDNKIKMKMLQTGAEQVIGTHDAPVKHVFWCEEMKMIISGSWDKTLKFWDGNSSNPVAKIQLPERVYAMDVKYPLMVVGCADRHIHVYDLSKIRQNPTPYKTGTTSLKMQTRTVCCFPDKNGYAVASIEGRCSIVYLENASDNFAFKCHRTGDEIYAVNCIDFHPKQGVFSTAGSDGTFAFWDKDHRQRLRQFNSCNYPITATKFNTPGDIFAYAVSYDWSKGFEGNHANIPKKILLHRVLEDMVRKANTK